MANENIVRTVIHTDQQPTEAQIREIEAAASMPVVPDEDAPELTLEQYAEMAAIAKKTPHGGCKACNRYPHLSDIFGESQGNRERIHRFS